MDDSLSWWAFPLGPPSADNAVFLVSVGTEPLQGRDLPALGARAAMRHRDHEAGADRGRAGKCPAGRCSQRRAPTRLGCCSARRAAWSRCTPPRRARRTEKRCWPRSALVISTSPLASARRPRRLAPLRRPRTARCGRRAARRRGASVYRRLRDRRADPYPGASASRPGGWRRRSQPPALASRRENRRHPRN